jgi:uncharacterized protein (TIGR03435 family)
MTMIQFLGEWLLRSSILILAGALLLWLMRVKNPSVRLTAWTAMLAGSLLTPVLTAVLPKAPLACLQSPAALFPAAAWGPAPMGASPSTFSYSAPPQSVAAKPFDWTRFAAILYVVITSALLLRLFAGLVLSRRLLRRSRPTGIADVRASDEVASPVTIGILRPAMVLPADWHDWAPGTLDAVLAHERSHIRRRDPAVQLVSAIHRALLWASPLSWFLDRSIVRTAEQISDDDAVAVTADRASYAEVLLEFIQRGVGRTNPVGVAMARYDRPEKRIRRILNATAIPRAIGRWGVAGVLCVGLPIAYLAAAADPQEARAAFEVASIKPAPSGPRTVGIKVHPGGRVVISSLPLKSLIAAAFGLSYWQVSGGEEWTTDTQYQIEAKPSEAMAARIKDLRYTNYAIEDPLLREMLQSLLLDRFHLKFHREAKTGDVYHLARSGKTLRLRPAESLADLPTTFGSIGYVGGQWSIHATSMAQLAKFASDYMFHVPVLDRTEIAGSYDYRQAHPDEDPKYGGDNSASFLRYIAELGLKMEKAKGSVQIFVMDHAAKPTSN